MSAIIKLEQHVEEFSNDQIELIRTTVCKGASNLEMQLFLHVCKKTGLDPILKQIYSIPRGGQRTIQVSIDGLRLIAERTRKYSPGKETVFNYDEKGNLLSATAYIKKMTEDGTWHEIGSTAMFNEYNPGNNPFWKKMPTVMLAKCAEASALRRAFPAELSGIYVQEEMQQADHEINSEIKEIVKEKKEDIEKKIKDRKREIMTFVSKDDLKYLENYVVYLKSIYKTKTDEDLFLSISTKDFVESFHNWRQNCPL